MQEMETSTLGIRTPCNALLEKMGDFLRRTEPVSREDTRHAAKLPRDEGDIGVDELAAQCRAIDLARADRETTGAEVLEASRRARALREVIYRHELVRARLRAARVRAESESWRSNVAFHAALRRAAAREAGAKAGLERVRQFFIKGRELRRGRREPR